MNLRQEAREMLKSKNLKDTLYNPETGKWGRGKLSLLLADFAIEAHFIFEQENYLNKQADENNIR